MATRFNNSKAAEMLDKAAKDINDAMTWRTSPEGQDYWSSVVNNLQERAAEARTHGLDKSSKVLTQVLSIPASEGETIHIYFKGGSLCGLPMDVRDWPKGHMRVSLDDRSKVTCTACGEKLTPDLIKEWQLTQKGRTT